MLLGGKNAQAALPPILQICPTALDNPQEWGPVPLSVCWRGSSLLT